MAGFDGMASQGGWTRRDLYWAGGLLAAALGIRLYLMPALFFPFWGRAPEMVFAVSNRVFPQGPHPVYLWIGRTAAFVMSPALGLALVSVLFGLVGTLALAYIAFRLTGDRAQTLVCAAMFMLTPVALRQGVVQEVAAVQSGVLLAALAVLLSDWPRRTVASGLLFGAAVGVHPASLLAIPAFFWLFRRREGDAWQEAFQAWGVAAAVVWGVSWLWLLYRFGAADAGIGDWIGYLVGGVGAGYRWVSVGELIPQAVHVLEIHARLLSWGVVVVGVTGLVLMFSHDRDRFWLLLCYGLPFAAYAFPRSAPAEEGVYLSFLAPVYALAAGTAWREGSRYLAEGLQEPLRGTLGVVAAVIIGGELFCLLYTDNTLLASLHRRERQAKAMADVEALGARVQVLTRPEDLVVVIPDPRRPGVLDVVETPWAVACHTNRQVVFGSRTEDGWVYHTVPLDRTHAWGRVPKPVVVDDALVGRYAQQGRRFFSEDPFPFLHAEEISGRLASLPVRSFEPSRFFLIFRGRRPVDDPDGVAEVFYAASETYLGLGYETDAAACLEEAAHHAPDREDFHRRLGNLYMKLEIFNRASAVYTRLQRLVPDAEDVAVNLSMAYFRQGDAERAVEICRTYLTAHPGAPDVLYNLGGYYLKGGKTEAARRTYEAYVEVATSDKEKRKIQDLLRRLAD